MGLIQGRLLPRRPRDIRSPPTIEEIITATTAFGAVRGFTQPGDDVVRFCGIPFAVARRGQSPAPPDNWSQPRDCFHFGPCCPQGPSAGRFLCEGIYPLVLEKLIWFLFPQPDVDTNGNPTSSYLHGNMDEHECLNLNIYTLRASLVDQRKRPVMVWIHGGAFQAGANSQIDGALLSERGDVVVVALNYRLGVFTHQPADGVTNLGLRDVIAGLRWIAAEIGAFGGDCANVTIFGESAGAHLCATLYGSPAAQGLFHRCICSSGVHDAFWSEAEYPHVRAQHGINMGLGDDYSLQDYIRADGNAMAVAADASSADPTLVHRQGTMQVDCAPVAGDDIVPSGGPMVGIHQGLSSSVPLLIG